MKRVLLVFPALLLSSCLPKPLPVLGQVPPFQLIQQDGKVFDSSALNGKVWVADFIFTNCEGPCPRMTGKMETLQKQTEGDNDLHLVSFSVDPQRDTPPVLTRYAARFHADFQRWTFLTGSLKTLNMLGLEIFKLQSVDNSLSHSTRFVLIDRKGRIRAYYGIGMDDPVGQLKAAARLLEKELS